MWSGRGGRVHQQPLSLLTSLALAIYGNQKKCAYSILTNSEWLYDSPYTTRSHLFDLVTHQTPSSNNLPNLHIHRRQHRRPA